MVCRQQIALDVRLDRLGGTPWGFRLVGGAGCKLPLTVVQVEGGSPAARGGLADGDEVLSIGGVSACDITHEAAHDIICGAPLRIELAVIRVLSTPPTEESSGLSPNPTIDTLLPSPEVPVPPHDRSRTSSPFIHAAKPFRPFSAEPFDGIPPIEKPIILSPFYHDDFSKLKKKEAPPPTKFKLEINKDYVPEDEDRSVAESYSKIQDITQLTSLEELNKELDLQQIENTAGFVSDESLKALTASGDMQTVDYESKSEETNRLEITEAVGKTVDATNVSASLLAQLIDQTADEISNSKTVKDISEVRDISEVKDSFIVATESEIKASSTFDSKMESNVSVSCHESKLVSNEMSLQSDEHLSVKKSSEFSEEIEKHQVEKSEKCTKSVAAKNESQTLEAEQSVEEHSQSAKEIIQSINHKTIEENMELGIRNVEDKKKQAKKDISELKREITVTENKNKRQIEGATKSLTEIKQHAISTANLLAEQRAYTLGLQTIPNIQGHAHSSYHYDLLLKTFFIHLTDVMVALSRIILAEGVSRSNSPMPVKNEETKQVSQQISTQTTKQEETSIQTSQLETKAELETKKMTAAKFAQMSQSKTEEMTEKMDAVITEFKKDVEEQDHIEISHSVRGKSISKIEEEVLKENDPLEWLAKVDENKSTSTTNEATLRKDSGTDDAEDLAGKIIYVATVEAHQISNMEDIESALTKSAATESSAAEVSSEKSEEILTQSEAVVTQAEQITIQAEEVNMDTEGVTTHAEEITISEGRKLSQEHILISQETAMSSIAHDSIESAQMSQKTIVQETSISEQSSQSIAIEMSKLESMTQESTLKNTIETSQEADEKQNFPIVDERRLSKGETPLESRKSSIEQLESVRNPDLSSQVSVTSDDSYKPVPQTPLTDEYVFRLQMHLDETKNPLPPSPPVEHEDPYTVKKPKLIPHIETSIESALYADPEKELTDAFPAKVDKVADTNAFFGKVDKIADTNALPGKLDIISDTAAPSANANKEIASKTNFNERKGAAAFPGTNDTTAPPVLSTIAHIVTSVAESATNIVNLNASNIEISQTLATNIEKEFAATTHGARSTSAKLVEETLVQDMLLEEQRKSAILTSAIDTTIESIERYKQEVGMEVCPQSNGRQHITSASGTANGFASQATSESPRPGTQASFIKQNCGLVTKHYGVITHHGGLVRRSIQDGGAEQNGGCIANGAVDGTTRGIVDSLDNAGILDPEVAKQLGRPGLTDDKIAELISGEADMMKEAHVIGVDFDKIKPHIEALKDSEVLRALNDELAKAKEEKKREERKYTTFLQRPDRAVPRSRFGYVTDPDLLEDPYKIQIVKQPKPRVAPDYKPQDFETGPLPWEARAANEPPPPPPVPREEPVLVPEEAPLYLEALDNLPESEVPDLEDTGIPLPPPVPATSEPRTPPTSPTGRPSEAEQSERPSEAEQSERPSEEEQSGEVAAGSEHQEPAEQSEEMQAQLAERILGSIQSMVDPAASMEEQLLQMRAQLSALAQLPGVITQTLELVTEQLGQLTRQEKEGVIRCESAVTVTEVEDDTPCVQECVEVAEVSREVSLACETTVSATAEAAAEPQPRAASPERAPCEPPAPCGDEDRAAPGEQDKIDAQKKELMVELQKEHEQRQVKQRAAPRVAPARPQPAFGPRVPSERPLVLPGGRRWRNEKDAFNDDFIRETLASQAEIIQGKTKGCQYDSIRLPYDERINFMKWEKPAKTMDYLKESDVYKLVHNMDAAPGRQVERLPSVVMSESEYREQSRIREILQDNSAKTQPQKRRVGFAPSETYCDAPATNDICDGAKCPEACGGVLPDVCAAKRRAVLFHIGDPKKPGNELVCDESRAKDGRPVVKELIVPPAAPPENIQPRQISHAEAVEIVTNYLEAYAHVQSRDSPAMH